MNLAYVLISVEIGTDKEVLKELREIPDVREVYEVYGLYDIIVKVEAIDMSSLKDIIWQKIRRIDKVRSTVTTIIIE